MYDMSVYGWEHWFHRGGGIRPPSPGQNSSLCIPAFLGLKICSIILRWSPLIEECEGTDNNRINTSAINITPRHLTVRSTGRVVFTAKYSIYAPMNTMSGRYIHKWISRRSMWEVTWKERSMDEDQSIIIAWRKQSLPNCLLISGCSDNASIIVIISKSICRFVYK